MHPPQVPDHRCSLRSGEPSRAAGSSLPFSARTGGSGAGERYQGGVAGQQGGPTVGKGRANPSNLLIAAGRSYVIDCGYGVTRQLIEAGVPAREVRTILITTTIRITCWNSVH
jgi:hypothetical protein